MKTLRLAALSAAALLLAGCASASADEPESTPTPSASHVPFWQAVDSCDGHIGSGFEVLDDGESLVIDGAVGRAPGASTTAIFCVLDELDMSQADQQRIQSTRALDGTMTAEWDGYEATWTYHPDDGLDMVLTQEPFEN
ncbi:hypothetical protein [Agrococcus sp. Marseille-Q4369]|uniref:hypothetical protein n=1 Tax=Agrococcus sp. Marseille-Q4369 TaxID=2810513 RepID=UPI001B8C5C68|nr:hypothetical protein [Agrococcus sp. Marseille-Q4369]QUW18910.1 hypothetical protein JSQ78_00550 [Agrococcus sp. Marseille-Q4369]